MEIEGKDPEQGAWILSKSAEETRDIGYRLGRVLDPGSVVFFAGDLGSGKTTFIQGLARGLGIPEEYYITSPTYNIINEYAGRVRFFHADLYRLAPGDLEDIGMDEILAANGVVAIEWPDRLGEDFPFDFQVKLEFIEDFSRRISIIGCGHKGSLLIERVKKFWSNGK